MEQSITNINKRIIFQGAVAQMTLDPFGIHGVRHWHTVYWSCLQLWSYENEVHDVPQEHDWFFWNFAMLHDCCRLYDTSDPGHGARAAKLVPDDDSAFNRLLRQAILGHTAGKTATSQLVGICWDADRLDLERVGIVPDPKLMSTKAGKYYAEMMQPKEPEVIIDERKKEVYNSGSVDSPDNSSDGVR